MKKGILTVLTSVFILSGCAFAGEKFGTLTVEADAIVKAKPDKVVFSVGVVTRSADLMEAKNQSFNAVKKAVEYCKSVGISENNIKMDYINISPEWNNYEKIENVYRVEQNLSIILEDISKYDEIITELLKSGINKVGYIDFQVTELKKYKNEARRMAIQSAKEKGQFLAGESGIKLGKIININEVNAGWFPVGGYANASANDMSQNMLGAGDAEDGLLTHAAAPGTVSVRSQVVLTYKIK